MAHKNREPGRRLNLKKRLPRSRGEKYLAPPVYEYGERSEVEPVRRRVPRRGGAHDILKSRTPHDRRGRKML